MRDTDPKVPATAQAESPSSADYEAEKKQFGMSAGDHVISVVFTSSVEYEPPRRRAEYTEEEKQRWYKQLTSDREIAGAYMANILPRVQAIDPTVTWERSYLDGDGSGDWTIRLAAHLSRGRLDDKDREIGCRIEIEVESQTLSKPKPFAASVWPERDVVPFGRQSAWTRYETIEAAAAFAITEGLNRCRKAETAYAKNKE